jgi:hypothetical protein
MAPASINSSPPPWLAAEGVTRLRLFAREAGANSDVDLIADLDRPLALRFFGLARIASNNADIDPR